MRLTLLLILACAVPFAAAQPPGAAEKVLQPASCGVHQTLWVRHYATQLFLPAGQPPTALADPAQPKLLRLRVIDPSHLPPQIPARWRHALTPLLGAQTMARLQALYQQARAGDLVVVAYDPDGGVTLTVNGQVLAEVPGHAAVDALLQAWADDHLPLEEQLKRTTARNPCA